MHTDTLRHPTHAGRPRRRPTGGARLFAWAHRLLEQKRRRARARHTVHALRQLSDATLKDIGIDRSEIPLVAAGHNDRRRPGNGSVRGGSSEAYTSAPHSQENPEMEQPESYYWASLAGLALVLALVLALLASGAALAAGCDRFATEQGAAEAPPT